MMKRKVMAALLSMAVMMSSCFTGNTAYAAKKKVPVKSISVQKIPYGMLTLKKGKTFKDYLNEKGLSVIGWNCESYDSRTYTTKPEQLVQAVKDTMGTKKEVTVIMHDTYGKQKTADALPDIIEHFNEVNYELKKYE